METVSRIDDNLVKAIQQSSNYPSIIRMGVFGSYARGDQTQESDIDIVYDYDATMIDNMLDCIEEINDRVEKKIDFVAYYLLFRKNMDAYDISFRDNVLREVVWIYDRDSVSV
jgi:predicted nucleotidyltransferase